MLVAKILAVLSISAGVIGASTGFESDGIDLSASSPIAERAIPGITPEAICLAAGAIYDPNTHLCIKKTPISKRQLIPKGRCMSDNDCVFGKELCLWVRANGQNQCVMKESTVGVGTTRITQRNEQGEHKEQKCRKYMEKCENGNECCSGRCGHRLNEINPSPGICL